MSTLPTSYQLREADPLELLDIIYQFQPVHYSHFAQVAECYGLKVSKATVRVLTRRGWIWGCTWFTWMLTDKGNEKARSRILTDRDRRLRS